MDTLQVAILLAKLEIFEDEIAARQTVAQRYHDALGDVVRVPHVRAGATSVWASYTILIEKDRDALAAALQADGVPTKIYYPKPLHHQAAYRHFPVAEGGLRVSQHLAARVLSLPMHPYLDAATQDLVVERLCRALVDGS